MFTTNPCFKVFVSAAEMRKAQGKRARQNKEAKGKLAAQRKAANLQAKAPIAPTQLPHEGNTPHRIALGCCQLTLPSLRFRSHEPPHAGYKANKAEQPGQSRIAESKPDEAPRAPRHCANAGCGGGEANRCEWEPSHDVGSGRLHGGECGWERRANADTERGAGEPIHRRSCCTGNYKGALCNHTVHSHSTLILCTHTLHSYSALILCTHTLHSHSALTLCTYTLILCTHTLHSCSAFIIRTRTQHSYSTLVLYTRTLHWYATLML